MSKSVINKAECRWCGKKFKEYNNNLVNHEQLCSPFSHSNSCNCDKCITLKKAIDLIYSEDIDVFNKLLKYKED